MAFDDYPGSDEDILFRREDRLAWITFNQPDRYNPFGPKQFARLERLLDDISVDPEIGVVILTGAGKAFSAGGDLNTLDKKGLVETGIYALRGIGAIRRCRKPVIAMVNGVAVGGGNEVVIACDLAIAARSARLGQAGTLVGACPVVGGTNLLTMQIGEKRAKQIVYYSEKVSAETALDWGWVNAVADDDKLEEVTREWAGRLLTLHPQSVEIAKASSNIWWNLAYDGMVNGLQMMSLGVPPDSMNHARQAFLAKEKPDFDPWRYDGWATVAAESPNGGSTE
jgi:2-ketocyclohexanecarboxyl-CoA hydrolase